LLGALPIPLLDDWLVSSMRQGTLRGIAESHNIDMDDEALCAIADEGQVPPRWTDVASSGVLLRLFFRQWRKMLVVFVATKRAKIAADNFEIATLFDHYCSQLHVGMGLDATSGKRLRECMNRARKETAGGLSRQSFQRAVTAMVHQGKRAPKRMTDVFHRLSGGKLRTILRNPDGVQNAEEIDKAVEAQLLSKGMFGSAQCRR